MREIHDSDRVSSNQSGDLSRIYSIFQPMKSNSANVV